jgi:MSHA biogenesis protein MshN
MSVLNTMLRDLEKRGELPALSLAPLEPGRAFAQGAAQPAAERPRHGLRALLALLLVSGAAAAALWLWQRPAPAPVAAHNPAAQAVPAPAALAPPASAPTALSAQADPASASPPPAAPAAEPAAVQPIRPHARSPVARPPASERAQHPKAPIQSTATAEPEPAAISQSAAQSELTHAMDLIGRGRSSEATQLLMLAVSKRPAWHDARSALAALQAEGGDRRQALATLLAGAALDPGRFARTAAQLQAELNDPIGALQTLEQVAPEARDESFHALAAAVAQRAGQHDRAIAEYGEALRSAPGNAVAWVGLGVSLQALGRNEQALAAYRGAAQGALSADLRRFVNSRIEALTSSTTPAPAVGAAH